MAVGWVSFKGLSVDLFPEVNIPVVSVVTVYPGAGPAEIETLVTKPIEDEVSAISGLKRLNSKSLEGVSQVVAEFKQGVDVKYAEQQIRDKVSMAKAKIPTEAKEPLIRKFDPSDQPILTLAITAPNLNQAELYDLADQIVKPRLEQVNNVGTIEIIGGRKREIHVTLDRNKLHDRAMSVSQVAGQIGASGENIPTGKVNTGTNETVFRSLGEFGSVKEIEATLVNLYGNDASTRIADIGRVDDTLEDEKTRAFLGDKRSLFIDVFRQSGSNTIAVVDDVKKQVIKLQTELSTAASPADIQVIKDGSVKIRDNVADVYETIFIGLILTIITVFFFLGNARSTLITGVSLPVSLIGSFILMKLGNFSINIVSLLALTLAIGLLIDDAIVVIENIFRRMELGEDAKTASDKGTAEIQLSVFAITLVVIAVFGPVAFMSGIVGQFLKQFGLTIAFSMAISLFVALTLIPMLTAYFGGGGHGAHAPGEKSNPIYDWTLGRAVKAFDRFQTSLENGYVKVLQFTVKKPLVVLAASFLVFALSIYSVTKVPGTFVPEEDNGEMTVTLDMAPGTNLDGLEKVAKQVQGVIQTQPEFAFLSLTVGGRNGEANKGEFYVKLKPGKERKGTTTEAFKNRLRGLLTPYAEARPAVRKYDPSGGMQTQPITLDLIGTDQKQLEEYTTKLLEKFHEDKRMVDIDSTYRPGKPEVQIHLRDGSRT
jgi:HAE1 family hydrophobic/amphiphilic exporter-1